MQLKKALLGVFIVVTTLFHAGCATYTINQPAYDPWEGYNRAIYSFNDKMDRYALKPIAKGYKFVTPNFVEKGIQNFFSNLDDVTVTLNDFLQGKIAQGASDAWRFLLNSTIGIVGLFDVATPLGLPKHHEDFGQTLGKWGVAEGPYFVLPFLGPATIRSTTGRLGDYVADPLTYVSPNSVRLSLVGGEFIDTRAQLLQASDFLDTVFDPYLFLRDAYVSNRRQLTYDKDAGPDISEETIDELDILDKPTSTQSDKNELDELDSLDDLDELDKLDIENKDELDLLDELELPE